MDKQADFETHVALIMEQDLIRKKDAKWLAWVEGQKRLLGQKISKGLIQKGG